jgi:hypothetical protein
MHARIGVLLQTMFSTRSVQMGYKKNSSKNNSVTRVEAGSNTSTVTLRVVGGDEKGSLKSETVKCGRESRVARDSDLRKTALARASSTYKRQTRPLVREGAPQKQHHNFQTVINIWS